VPVVVPGSVVLEHANASALAPKTTPIRTDPRTKDRNDRWTLKWFRRLLLGGVA
jgi:hypothetical protein